MSEKIHDDIDSLTFGGGSGKGYQFRVKAPNDSEGLADLFNAFMDQFDVSFTLNEDKFKKFPKKFIIEDSIKEVDNIF